MSFFKKWCERKIAIKMLSFFTKVEEMARVGSRDHHTLWGSKHKWSKIQFQTKFYFRNFAYAMVPLASSAK